jgi:hypothetical protein
VNGIFEPTEEVYNDMPVYRKRGDEGTWLELVSGATGHMRWYVKPTANRGASSVCFGYLEQDKTNLLLPHDVGEQKWTIYDGAAFVHQDGVTSALRDPHLPIPEAMLELLNTRRATLAEAHALKCAMVSKHSSNKSSNACSYVALLHPQSSNCVFVVADGHPSCSRVHEHCGSGGFASIRRERHV